MTFTPIAGGGLLNGRSGAGDGDNFSAVSEDPLGRCEDPLNWSVWDSLCGSGDLLIGLGTQLVGLWYVWGPTW